MILRINLILKINDKGNNKKNNLYSSFMCKKRQIRLILWVILVHKKRESVKNYYWVILPFNTKKTEA